MKTQQQGDVLIRAIDNLPKKLKRKQHPRGAVLAEGEVTGHAHVVIGDGVEVWEAEDGTIYVSAPRGGELVHEEHHAQYLEPGHYRIGIVREYDHFAEEARNVAD